MQLIVGIGRAVAAVLALLLLSPAAARAESENERLRVAMLVSSSLKSSFWKSLTRPMRAAAEDLGIELKIYEADRSHTRYVADAIAAIGEFKARYLLLRDYRGVASDLMTLTDIANVELFILNTPLDGSGLQQPGAPRSRHVHYLGSRTPDNEGAGFLQAQTLLAEARQRDFSPIRLVGLVKEAGSATGRDRSAGLHRALRGAADAVLLQEVAVADNEDPVPRLDALLARHKDANLVWCADDELAELAIARLKAAGKVPGGNVLVGGIDWRPRALAAVEAGEQTISVGGHLLEGLAALALVYDHAHGHDFDRDPGLVSLTPMLAMPAEMIPTFRRLFVEGDLNAADYRRFTLTHGGRRDFSLMRLLNMLEGEPAAANP